jgi:WD40 repeat protein
VTLWQADAVPRPLYRVPIAWPERVQCLALNPSGNRLIVAGRRHVGLWTDAATGVPAQTIDLAAGGFSGLSCSSAVIRPDGGAAIVGSSDGQLFEIDMASGRISRLELPDITGMVNSLVFDPGGRFLYVAAWQAERPLIRIDLSAQPPAAMRFETAAAPRGLALSADADTLYAVHERGEISAHDATDGRPIARARVGSAALVDLTLVPDGIVVGDEEGVLTRLTPDLKRSESPVRIARSTITGLFSSTANGWVAVAGAGDPLRLWRTDMAPPLEQVVARDAGGGLGVRVAADGSRLSVFGGASVVSWSRADDEWRAEPMRVRSWPEGWQPQAASRDGTMLALSAAYAQRDADDRVRLLMPDTTIQVLPGFAAKLWHGTFSPSDRWLAVGGLDRPLRIAAWDLRQPQAKPWTYEIKEGAGVTALALSPDESLLAIADMRSCVYVVGLGAERPEPLRSYCDKTDMPGELSFDPSGARLAVGSLSGRLRVLRISADSLALERVLDGQQKPTSALAFDESGRWLASAASDGSLRFWESGGWQSLGTQRVPGDTFVRDIVPLPGGNRFVLLQQGGRRLSVWDVDPERAVRRAEALGTQPFAAESVASGGR